MDTGLLFGIFYKPATRKGDNPLLHKINNIPSMGGYYNCGASMINFLKVVRINIYILGRFKKKSREIIYI